MNLISFYEHVRWGLWASSGPFPLSAHYGLYQRGRDPPTNPSRHLKKERSDLPLKWLLKEGRGRSPTAVVAAAAARICAAATATTAATPCPGHGFFSTVIAMLPSSSHRRRRPLRTAAPPSSPFPAIPSLPSRSSAALPHSLPSSLFLIAPRSSPPSSGHPPCHCPVSPPPILHRKLILVPNSPAPLPVPRPPLPNPNSDSHLPPHYLRPPLSSPSPNLVNADAHFPPPRSTTTLADQPSSSHSKPRRQFSLSLKSTRFSLSLGNSLPEIPSPIPAQRDHAFTLSHYPFPNLPTIFSLPDNPFLPPPSRALLLSYAIPVPGSRTRLSLSLRRRDFVFPIPLRKFRSTRTEFPVALLPIWTCVQPPIPLSSTARSSSSQRPENSSPEPDWTPPRTLPNSLNHPQFHPSCQTFSEFVHCPVHRRPCRICPPHHSPPLNCHPLPDARSNSPRPNTCRLSFRRPTALPTSPPHLPSNSPSHSPTPWRTQAEIRPSSPPRPAVLTPTLRDHTLRAPRREFILREPVANSSLVEFIFTPPPLVDRSPPFYP